MLQNMVFIGAAANLFGVFFYIRKTLRGETKPNRVTWLMWSIAPLIATGAAVSDGVGWAVLPVFMAGFGPLLVFIASLSSPKAYWKLGPFDYVCGTFSFLALLLWTITKEPLLAISCSIAADAFAALPTIFKCWKHPETESALVYSAGLFAALTGFFALKTFSLSEIAFPAYLVLMDICLILAIYRGRMKILAF